MSRFGSKTRLTGQPMTSQLATWLGRSPIELVQYWTITMADGDGQETRTITSADPSRSRLIWLGSRGTDNDGDERVNDSSTRIAFTNATTITADRGSTRENCVTSFCVVTYRPGVLRSVQRGTITGASTATLSTPVNVNKSVLTQLGLSTTNDNSLQGYITLTDSTTITAVPGTGGGNANNIQGYEIAEFW